MLVDGGINYEHTGISNILFNYSYHSILASEFEELKNKMLQLRAKFFSGKHRESDRSHSGFLRMAKKNKQQQQQKNL